ncbi:MAG: hypothetical protein HY529_04150 [Chloroflexi bacterium]|nr:hypothetical protein [Chloroflexota bacterium]
MAQQQGIAKGDTLQKLGSAGFIAGGLLLLIFNFLFPRAADPSNTQDMLTKWGSQEGLTKLSAFFLTVGMWGLMKGAAGVYRSISNGGAAWARLGFYGIVVGTTIFTTNNGILAATASTAANWLAAPVASKGTAYSIAATLSTASGAVFTMSILTIWLALFFLGIGMSRSAVYPRWLGWVGLILGALTVVIVGIPQFFAGLGTTTMTIFAVLATLTAIWALVLGIWVARKAW